MQAEENGNWYADVVAEPGQYDGLPFHATLSIGPYTALVFPQ